MKDSEKENILCGIIKAIYADEARKLRTNLENPHSTLLKNETAFKKWQESLINTSVNKIFKQIAIEIQKIFKNLSVVSLYTRLEDKIKKPLIDFFNKMAEKELKSIGDYDIIGKSIENLDYKGFASTSNELVIHNLINYCDNNFKKFAGCKNRCNHPSGKCSGSCTDCLREMQYHHSDGRSKYDCCNMLRYYLCHTMFKRCSEILYALETLDLQKYTDFNIMSIGCGAAPDLMAFKQISGDKKVSYHGIEIEPKWKEIHDFILQESLGNNDININFENRDIYDLLSQSSEAALPYNVIILQYMIAGHIYGDRAEKIDLLFDEIIDKLIARKTCGSPLLLIINDIDHKKWICDYFNLFTSKLRKRGLKFKADKRHFEPRETAGSKLYKSRTNRFLPFTSKEYRDKYNAHAPCSAAQLIIEVM